MSDCQCNTKSCPEPVSTVNVSITEISLGDGIDIFKRDTFTTVGAVPSTTEFVLTFIPYSSEALQVFVNGSLQREGIDYARDILTLTFLNGIGGASHITAQYVGTDYSYYEPTIRPGTIVGWAGGVTPPTGYLLCNGGEVPEATYPALYAAIGNTYDIGGETTDYFRVPNITVNYTDPAAGQSTGPALIKT